MDKIETKETKYKCPRCGCEEYHIKSGTFVDYIICIKCGHETMLNGL